jgi:hypothetical protein
MMGIKEKDCWIGYIWTLVKMKEEGAELIRIEQAEM